MNITKALHTFDHICMEKAHYKFLIILLLLLTSPLQNHGVED